MKRYPFLLLLLFLATFAGWLDSCNSPTETGSPPTGNQTVWTGAFVRCQDNTVARGVSFWLDNDYSRIKYESISTGNDAGLAPAKPMTYEGGFFSTDPPWKIEADVEKGATQCGIVSPLPTCVNAQHVTDVILEWKDHPEYPKYLQADLHIVCQ